MNQDKTKIKSLTVSEIEVAAKEIEKLVQQDPGERGLKLWAKQGDLLPAVQMLAERKHVAILTGFYILSAGVIETDGPSGAVVLAAALEKAGVKVTVLTDDHAHKIMQITLNAAGCKSTLLSWSKEDLPEPNELLNYGFDAIVALERPGRAQNGSYHNFRGQDISEFVLPYDNLFIKAREQGIPVIGIGDGGNELGMGNVSEAVSATIAPHDNFSCPVISNYCICCGVSNWGGYAVSAVLALVKSDNLLLDEDSIMNLIAKGVEAGAVDGVSGKCEVTVDGLPLSWEKSIISTLHKIIYAL